MSAPGRAAPGDGIDPRHRRAAANNAAWCASMCRAHGLTTHQDGRRWWSSSRTPLFYPDAVTLDPSTGSDELLDGVDTSAGCSVKDSFHALDLAAAGFRPLFDATWIHAPAADVDPPRRWHRVRDREGLQHWQQTWGEHAAELFLPTLLEDPDVALVNILEGDTRAGVAVLNRSAEAVGISNLVCAGGRPVEIRRAVVSAAAELFPGLDVVGWEQGTDLTAALAAGMKAAGGLRVWAC